MPGSTSHITIRPQYITLYHVTSLRGIIRYIVL